MAILRWSALGDVCNLVVTVRVFQRQWHSCGLRGLSIGKGRLILLIGLSGVECVVNVPVLGESDQRKVPDESCFNRFETRPLGETG